MDKNELRHVAEQNGVSLLMVWTRDWEINMSHHFWSFSITAFLWQFITPIPKHCWMFWIGEKYGENVTTCKFPTWQRFEDGGLIVFRVTRQAKRLSLINFKMGGAGEGWNIKRCFNHNWFCRQSCFYKSTEMCIVSFNRHFLTSESAVTLNICTILSKTAWLRVWYCFSLTVLLTRTNPGWHFVHDVAKCSVYFRSIARNRSWRSQTHFIAHLLPSYLALISTVMLK